VTFLVLPRPVTLPAAPFLLFWFLQNVLFGIVSFQQPTGVDHWAHIGGFLFGLALGRYKGYGGEARVETLKERIFTKLERGGGWRSVEKELRRLLALSPTGSRCTLRSGPSLSGKGRKKASERHYQRAVQYALLRDPLNGVSMLQEFMNQSGKTLSPQYHIKAADVLVQKGYAEEAGSLLRPFAGEGMEKNAVVEKALAYYIRWLLHTGRADEARTVYHARFLKDFPGSPYIEEIRESVRGTPGEILSPKPAPAVREPKPAPTPVRELQGLGVIAFMEKTVVDPAFWSILLFLNIAVPFYFAVAPTSGTSLLLFAVAFVMTLVHRMGTIGEMFAFMTGPSVKAARREADRKNDLKRARLVEECRRFREAAAHYERVLREYPRDAEARYHAARLYHEKLQAPHQARKHYLLVQEHLPEHHLFHRFATQALEELRQRGAAAKEGLSV